MTLEFIGLIGPQESSESQAPRGPLVDLAFIKAFAQAQEYAGFDKALLAVSTSAPDSMILASYVAALTDRMGLLVAHRPGFQAPTFAARQFATLDQLSGGRAAINVITGGDSGDLQRDGDYLDKDARYARTDEYLEVMHNTWTQRTAFDHHGTHYQVEDNLTLVKPVGKLPVYFSGASDAAVEVAAKHADVYMMWASHWHKCASASGRCARLQLVTVERIRFASACRCARSSAPRKQTPGREPSAFWPTLRTPSASVRAIAAKRTSARATQGQSVWFSSPRNVKSMTPGCGPRS